MASDDTILQTKFQPPQIKKTILRRERLLNVLKSNLDRRLVLICADAGYGKTTLLAQLLSETKGEFIYYNLNQSDCDPNNFFNHLIFGFRKYYPQFGEGVKHILSESPNFVPNAQRILTNLINDMLTLRNHTIVLDDYHTIKPASWVKSAFDYLLTYLPSNTHFVISTREMPELNVGRLLAKQELFTITKEDMRFTSEEVSQLLSVTLSADIGEVQLKRLIDVCQGWITGIQLILPYEPNEENIKSALNGFLSSNRPLFEYFATEIFVHEDEYTKKVLTSVSILEEIDPAVCNAIMGVTSSQRILRELERRNVFIFSIGPQKALYRLHPLFRNFLMQHLKATVSKAEISSLYQRAADFFSKVKQFEVAIEYYLRGERYGRAIRLIEEHAEKINTKGRTASLQRWLGKIPEDFFSRYPWLSFWRAFILDRIECQMEEAFNGYRQTVRMFRQRNCRKGMAKALLEMSTILARKGLVVEAKRTIRKTEEYCSASDIRLRTLIYNVKGMVAESLGDYARVKKYLLAMLSLAERVNDPSLSILTHCNLGVFYTVKGEFRVAEREYEAALAHIPKEGYYRRGIGILYADAAFTKIHLGKPEEAQALLKKGMDICIRYSDTPSLITSLHILGDLALAMNDLNKALEYNRQALSIIIEKGEERSRFSVIESIVYILIKKNDLASAREYFALLTQGPMKKADIDLHPNWAILLAEMKMAEGDTKAAIRYLRILLSIAQKKHLRFMVFKAYTYLAMIYERLGKKSCLELLVKALRETNACDYMPLLKQDPRFTLFFKKVARGKLDDDIKKMLHQTIEKHQFSKKEILFKVRAKFFGIPEIYSNGDLVSGKNWVSEKAKKLFCYFVMNNQRKILKDELVDTFWPDRTSADATNNLSSTIYYIRKALASSVHERYTKEIILYEERAYFLDPELGIETDAREFDRLVDEIKIQRAMAKDLNGALVKAMALYRGQFCAGWYEPWVENQRLIYENIYLKLLNWAGRDAYDHKDFENSLEHWKKLVSIDKYNEEAYSLLIQSLLSLGRKNEAINYFNMLSEAMLQTKTNPSAQTLAVKKILFS